MGGTGALSSLGAASSVPERRKGHAKTTARGISVRRIVRFCPVSTAPDPAHRALGRGRRHRRDGARSEEHTSELQSLAYLVCRLLLEKKKKTVSRGYGRPPLGTPAQASPS